MAFFGIWFDSMVAWTTDGVDNGSGVGGDHISKAFIPSQLTQNNT